MSDIYDPKKILDKAERTRYQEDYVTEKSDGLFHIGQVYEDEVAKTLYCKHCGGKEFNVGQGNHFTAIKCITCEYEVCIHEG